MRHTESFTRASNRRSFFFFPLEKQKPYRARLLDFPWKMRSLFFSTFTLISTEFSFPFFFRSDIYVLYLFIPAHFFEFLKKKIIRVGKFSLTIDFQKYTLSWFLWPIKYWIDWLMDQNVKCPRPSKFYFHFFRLGGKLNFFFHQNFIFSAIDPRSPALLFCE
jgi:hypothetical protein